METIRPCSRPPPLSFLTQQERAKAEREQAALKQRSDGVAWLGRRAIDYAKAHPEDPRAAESLYLTVRATRYGCFVPQEKEGPRKAVSKEAFQLLHTRFPKSVWAAKTPYYY
jgi:outer membrane protein assembly factor BamD (BamD/ComL family)